MFSHRSPTPWPKAKKKAFAHPIAEGQEINHSVLVGRGFPKKKRRKVRDKLGLFEVRIAENVLF